MNKGFFKKQSRKTIIITAIIVLVIAGFAAKALTSSKSDALSTATVSRGDITDSITVTGKVAPYAKSELGFERTGLVSGIYAKVGDKVTVGKYLAGQESSEIQAQYSGALADARAEKARLDELQRGLRTEESLVERAKLSSSQVSAGDALLTVENALNSSFLNTQKAFKSYFDVLFENAASSNPLVNASGVSQAKETDLSRGRAAMTRLFAVWSLEKKSGLDITEATQGLARSQEHIDQARAFADMISKVVYAFTPADTGMSQAEIDTYVNATISGMALMNTAAETLASAQNTFKTSISELSVSQKEFTLKNAGSSSEEIEQQAARYEKAQAQVQNYASMIEKTKLISPLAGTVTRVDVEVGEIATAGLSAVTVMSDDPFKIEVFIPEVDIAKVAIGNKARVTLDAYDDSVVFNASVGEIDPAETIVEGVPTYKVTLRFDAIDNRIKSGMTANIKIVVGEKLGTLMVPSRAIHNGKVTVATGVEGETREVTVTTGVQGDDGSVEILSGLKEGDMVVVAK